ncbi:MAG TPA: hypothetical protein VNC41_17630 [Acidimicrobiia bacterium]|nr:hypothetical protein [Acidimicrobiia bacterium]
MRRGVRIPLVAVATLLVCSALTGCGLKIDMSRPVCGDTALSTLSLMAQSVREATLVPCLEGAPTGWEFESLEVRNSGTEMTLKNDRGGAQALKVFLDHTCDTTGAVRIPSDEPGTTRYEKVERISPDYVGSRFYVFDGGCVTYEFNLETDQSSVLLNEASLMVGFVNRSTLRAELDEETGGVIENGP